MLCLIGVWSFATENSLPAASQSVHIKGGGMNLSRGQIGWRVLLCNASTWFCCVVIIFGRVLVDESRDEATTIWRC